MWVDTLLLHTLLLHSLCCCIHIHEVCALWYFAIHICLTSVTPYMSSTPFLKPYVCCLPPLIVGLSHDHPHSKNVFVTLIYSLSFEMRHDSRCSVTFYTQNSYKHQWLQSHNYYRLPCYYHGNQVVWYRRPGFNCVVKQLRFWLFRVDCELKNCDLRVLRIGHTCIILHCVLIIASSEKNRNSQSLNYAFETRPTVCTCGQVQIASNLICLHAVSSAILMASLWLLWLLRNVVS